MVLGMDILDMAITLARGLLMLSPRLMRILISSMVDMVLDMVDMVLGMDILDMAITLARGLLMLSPRLMPILISSMVDMVLDMDILDMAITLERGLPMLSPRLMLIHMSTMVAIVATMVILMLDMAMVDTSGDKSQDSKICSFRNDNHTCIGKLFGQRQWK